MSKSTIGPIYTLTEWITRLAIVNLLWLGFSIVGLVVFGFFPATTAMFTIIRKWIRGEEDVPLFQTFWSSFRKEFLKSNLLGLVIAIVAFIFYIDLQYMQLDVNTFLKITHIPLYIIMFFSALTSLYLFPVYVHYDISFLQMLKNAFLIMLINPINNIIMIVSIAITIYIMTLIPGLSFFFGGSFISFLIMAASHRSFQKIELKQQQQQELASTDDD